MAENNLPSSTPWITGDSSDCDNDESDDGCNDGCCNGDNGRGDGSSNSEGGENNGDFHSAASTCGGVGSSFSKAHNISLGIKCGMVATRWLYPSDSF